MIDLFFLGLNTFKATIGLDIEEKQARDIFSAMDFDNSG